MWRLTLSGFVPEGCGGSPRWIRAVFARQPLDTGETVDGRVRAALGLVWRQDRMVELDALGRGGVPTTGVGAVVLNVTMIRPDRNGLATMVPGAGDDRPLASSLNAAVEWLALPPTEV